MLVSRRNIAVRSTDTNAANQSVGEKRKVLHGSAEDRSGITRKQAVILAVGVEHTVDFKTGILVKVVGSAQNRAFVN